MVTLALLLSFVYDYLVSTFSSARSEHSEGEDWEDEWNSDLFDDRQDVMNDVGLNFMDWNSDISEDGLSEGSGEGAGAAPAKFLGILF